MPDTKIPEINKEYKPSSKEQDIRKWVYERYYQMKDNEKRKKLEKEWEQAEKAWDAFREPRDIFEWESNYYIPLTTSVVESILAEFVDQRIRPLILPRASEDIPRAKVMQHLFDYTWSVADGDMELFKVLKGTFIRGTAIAQEYYLKDRRMVEMIKGLNDLYNEKNSKKKKKLPNPFETEEKEIFEFDGAMMENVSLWDFFVDEKARDMNRGPYKARDCIRRYVMNIRDFRRIFQGPVWDPSNRAGLVRPGGDTNYYQFYKPNESTDKSEDVEVLWYWSRTPEDLLVIMANDVVVRMGPNIFNHKQLPFSRSIDIPRLDNFFAKGEPKLLESIQEELNTLRRMTIDRHHLDLDKSFLVSQTTQLDEEDLIARPHAMIAVDDPRNVQALEYGDIPSSVSITQRAITEDSVRVTGVDDRFQSVQKTPSTATEAAILKESTLKRIRMKIMLLTEGFMKDVSRQRVSNIIQFYSQPKLEKIVGEAGTQEYQREVERLAREGLLEVREGKMMRKRFPEIRLKNKELTFDQRGEVFERPVSGVTFFEARPETFVPIADGGYDIEFEAGSTLPISKPLMQSKMSELYDRLIQLTEATNYDAEKIGDILVEAHDLTPSQMKSDPKEQDPESSTDARIEMSVRIAAQENQEIEQGGNIPANGTPFAPPAHTEVHLAYLNSDKAQAMPEDSFKMLVRHSAGEMLSQLVRQGVPPQQAMDQIRQSLQGLGDGVQDQPALPGAMAPQVGAGPTQGNANNELAATIPGRIQGGGEVQTGMPPGPARVR